MIWILIAWLVCGLIAWFISLYEAGSCTVGELSEYAFMMLLAPICLVACVIPYLPFTSETVIWERKLKQP